MSGEKLRTCVDNERGGTDTNMRTGVNRDKETTKQTENPKTKSEQYNSNSIEVKTD